MQIVETPQPCRRCYSISSTSSWDTERSCSPDSTLDYGGAFTTSDQAITDTCSHIDCTVFAVSLGTAMDQQFLNRISDEKKPGLTTLRWISHLRFRATMFKYSNLSIVRPGQYWSMTGWWYTYPFEKYEFVSWDDSSHFWKVIEVYKSHVPNHQPDDINVSTALYVSLRPWNPSACPSPFSARLWNQMPRSTLLIFSVFARAPGHLWPHRSWGPDKI